MQKQIIPNDLEWQSAPSDNLVFSSPEQSRQETSQQNMQTPRYISPVEQIFQKEISKYVYPDFRYSCPNCGTLDVFIRISKSNQSIEIDCLECKTISIDNENGVKHTCLC